MTHDDDVEREVVEETVEETETLDQSSLSHEERREQEREALEAGGRVSLSEADWTRRTDEDRDEIRQAVDDLEVDDEPRTFDPVPPAPGVAVPDEAEDTPAGLTLTGERDRDVAPLSRADREAIEDAYEGEIVQALALYEARRGRVVRVVHDRGEGLEEDKAIVDDGEVRDLGSIVDDVDAIGADVDLSDLDESDLAPAEEEDEAREADVDEAEASEAEAAADEVEEEAGEGLGARIGGLLDRGGDEDDAGEEPDEAGDAGELGEPEDEPEPADEADEEGGSLRDRVSGLLDRGDGEEGDEAGDEGAEEPEETEPDPADEARDPDEDDEADEGGGIRDRVGGLLDRGGDEEPEGGEEPEEAGDAPEDASDEAAGDEAGDADEGEADDATGGDGDETGS